MASTSTEAPPADDAVPIAILSDSEDEGDDTHAALTARRKPRTAATDVVEVVDLTMDDDDNESENSRSAARPRARGAAERRRQQRMQAAARPMLQRPRVDADTLRRARPSRGGVTRARVSREALQRHAWAVRIAPFSVHMAQLLSERESAASPAPFFRVPEHLRNPQAAANAAAAARAAATSATAVAAEQEEDEEEEARAVAVKCAVCLGNVTSPVSTSCGHVFCGSCLTECMKKKKQCPQCRKKLTRRQIHRLFI